MLVIPSECEGPRKRLHVFIAIAATETLVRSLTAFGMTALKKSHSLKDLA